MATTEAVPTTTSIRNVALIGHGGVGKTTLAEALLARSGAIDRRGSVDAGTSHLDTEPESIARRMSIGMALAPFTWVPPDGNLHHVNVLDTPGYDEFLDHVETALAVADLAVLVVSAVDGVQLHTERLWRIAADRGVPRMVFVNKDDADRADFRRVLAEVRARLEGTFVALELPLGEQADLHGVADLVAEAAYEYDHGHSERSTLPADVAEAVHEMHDAVVDDIVSGDDAQLERYLAGDVPSSADLEHALAAEVHAGTRVPVLVGSATADVGIDRLADLICDLAPSPRPIEVTGGPGSIAVAPDPTGEPLVRVVATISDPYVGQLSIVKVLSGTIGADQHLVNHRSGTDERFHSLVRLTGGTQHPIRQAMAGDIVAVGKLRDTATDDLLGRPGGPRLSIDPIPRTQPIHSVAIEPRTQGDDDKLSHALQRLVAEDPSLRVSRTDEGHQTVLSGAGEVHLAVAVERLARKFGVGIDIGEVVVPYRETVVGTATAQGKVKKQSGGHGQFAVVDLRVSPLPRGSGVEFVDSVVGGAIPRQYIAAVHRGILECAAEGGLHGFPIVDVRIECYDGKSHAVDSSDMAFRTAAAHGLRTAMSAAGVAVLEPISLLTVTVPADLQGAVLGDITRRRGRIQGTDSSDDGEQVIHAHVPTTELGHYAVELRSLTGGRGRFQAVHDHHEALPQQLADTFAIVHRPG